jgi:hypothetical protein
VLLGLTSLVDASSEAPNALPTVWPGNAYRRSRKVGKCVDVVMARRGSSAVYRTLQVERELDEVLSIAGRASSYSNHAALLAELELESIPAGKLPEAEPHVVELARELLSAGHRETTRLRREDRWLAGCGVIGALAAGLGSADRRISRRRLLRYGLSATALSALPTGLGLALLSEVYAPEELAAFDSLARELQRDFAAVDESAA